MNDKIRKCDSCKKKTTEEILMKYVCGRHPVTSGIVFSLDYKIFCSQKCLSTHIQDNHSSIDLI